MRVRNLITVLALSIGTLLTLFFLLSEPAMPVQAEPAQILYVRPGATGNCISDPCGSIQQALDSTQTGDEIWVATGIYTENIKIAQGVSLRGGWNITFTQQNPYSLPTLIYAETITKHVMRVEQETPETDVVLIDGFILEGGEDGIHIWNGKVTVERSVVQNLTKQGIEVDGGTVLISATQIMSAQQGLEADTGIIEAVELHIYQVEEEGVIMEGTDGTPLPIVTLRDSAIEYAGQQGIDAGAGELRVINTTIAHSTEEGIVVKHEGGFTDPEVTITTTKIYDSGQRGLSVKAGTVTVVSSTISRTEDEGVQIRWEDSNIAPRVTIRDSTISDITQQGIDIAAGTLNIVNTLITHTLEEGLLITRTVGAAPPVVTLQDSILTGIAQQGIDVAAGTLHVLSSTLSGIAQEGVMIKHLVGVNAPVVTLTHSTLDTIAQQGIQSTDASLWLIENHIHHVISEGVDIEGGSVVMEGNRIHTISGLGYPGIYMTGTTATVHNNQIYDIHDHGIQIRAGSVTLTENEVYSTTDYGIYIRESPAATIQNNHVYSTGNHGIYVRAMEGAETQTFVSGNVVHTIGATGLYTRAYGIYAEGGVPTISGNQVHHTINDGIRTHKSIITGTLRDNIVHTTGDDGIEAQGSYIVLAGNIITGSTDNGIKTDNVELSAQIEANWVLSNATGIATRDTPRLMLVNNMIGDHLYASVDLEDTDEANIYHNTLVGMGTGQQGRGLVMQDVLTATLINNIIVSHTISIDAPVTTVVLASNTLFWANGSDPVTGTGTILINFNPRFVDPAHYDYHIQTNSPAIDHGRPINVRVDIDGDARPSGGGPDLGADEIPGDYHLYLPLIQRNYAPPDEGGATLPGVAVYMIDADPGDLQWQAENPYLDEPFPATFWATVASEYTGETEYMRSWDTLLRYRGDTARTMPKKSWKLFFSGSDLFLGNEELNLNADYIDQTLLRSAVGYDFLRRVGVPTPQAWYADVYINNVYRGLHSQVEQIDERFLARTGFNIHGNLYKPYYGSLQTVKSSDDNPDWWAYHYPKNTNRQSSNEDIQALITFINDTTDDTFVAEAAGILDVNEWVDWYAANILLGNFEMLEKNYYLYHDLSTGLWHIFPWDVDLSLGHNASFGTPSPLLDYDISWDNPLDSGSHASPKIDGKWNGLIDRMMSLPEARYFYGRRLVEIMEDEFSPDAMFTYIDNVFEIIQPHGEADLSRWRYTGFEFADGPAELKTYITNRRIWVYQQLPYFMPDLTPPLILNEVMLTNTVTLRDEAGDYDPWIELYNASPLFTWDLSGMYLSHDPDIVDADIVDADIQGMWRIPDGTSLAPQETLLIWVDGEPREGQLHTNFTLTSGTLYMWDRAVFDSAPIFQEILPSQLFPDVTYGRLPDGSGVLQALDIPTPGWRNVGHPPVVESVLQTPENPIAGMPITITAWITVDANIQLTPTTAAVTLWYRAYTPLSQPADYIGMPLLPLELANHSGTQHSNRTSSQFSNAVALYAIIPPQVQHTWIEYYVEVIDSAGQITCDRHGCLYPQWPGGNYLTVVGAPSSPLRINEVMPVNTLTAEDSSGNTPDWIEIHNTGSMDIDLGGMYLTDDPLLPTQYLIPAGKVVPAGGYYLLWLDGTGMDGHANFKLSGAGEVVALFDSAAHGYAPVDILYFEALEPDISWGRFPDGGMSGLTYDAGYEMTTPTPSAPNRLNPPTFTSVTRTPRWPTEGETPRVTARIVAGQPIVSATLWLDLGGTLDVIPMTAAANGTYWAYLPAFPNGAWVSYYLEAIDVVGQRTRYPTPAPLFTERYLVNYTPPTLLINEFLASNSASNADEFGEYDDWVELYNYGTVAISLDELALSDNLTRPAKWLLPSGISLPPGGYLLLWCDGTDTAIPSEQGNLHTNFKLDRSGEELGIFHTLYGNLPLDWLTFGPQQNDLAYGRFPDGTNNWKFLIPTPGDTNE
ncbi:MAG: CotH kinase family protein [Anaerolineae bacterium]|nr:CotH kinase family protein [Anaerolineae bacterium]